MEPGAFILAFISFWSIAVVGGYLMVVGLSNLPRHGLVSRPPAASHLLLLLRQRLFLLWDVFLLLIGALLAASGMFFLYMVVYG